MSNILYVIDAYLTSKEKYDVTIELINQLRKLDSHRKIMLINKNDDSMGIEKHVDFYREYLNGISVKSPPNHYINNGYESPYVYFGIDFGILENWLPADGFNNHVANIYNGFIFACEEAEKQGYKKIFRVEYDMLFDESEFQSIIDDLENLENQDYLFYGRREGNGASKEFQTSIDLHFCGFSTKLLKGFNYVNSEKDYWDLCEKIRYIGKWTEYVISMLFEYNNLKSYNGKIYYDSRLDKFPKSNFDRISSSDIFKGRWKEIPKICRIYTDLTVNSLDHNRIMVFYLNLDYESVEIETICNQGYHKKIKLFTNQWAFDILDRKENMVFMSKLTYGDKSETYVTYVNDETFPNLNCKFILQNNNLNYHY